MHLYDNLRVHGSDIASVLCYSKSTADFSNRILCVVSHDVHQSVMGMVHLDLPALGLDSNRPYKVTDLLHNQSYEWRGAHNYVALNPNGVSMHLFKVEQ